MSFCGEEVQIRRLFDVPSMGNMITWENELVLL
jgi:hypothetical protein